MTKVSKDQAKRIKAHNALFFLRSHPAFAQDILGDSLFDGAWFHMAKCCKRGKAESCRNMMSVYRGDEGWKNLKHQFDKEYKNDTDTPKDLQSVYATYKEVYGESWMFHHIEYWYETCFFVYDGNPYDRMECMDYKKWSRYGGPEGGANTFEDMLIRCASKVRRTYGSFNVDKDFYSDAEKKNHAEHFMFLRNDGDVICTKRNPEYIEVTNGVKNLRWLKWFVETDYCKKNWDGESMKSFHERIKALDKMPSVRKRLVKRYS